MDHVVPERTRYVVGVLLLLMVVLLWTGSNFVTQDIFDEGFNKPFIVTYLNTASFTVYLVPSIWRYFRRRSDFRILSVEYAQLPSPLIETTDLEVRHTPAPAASATGFAPLTMRETFELARIFVVVWFLANWTINSSLRYTTVASATILASTSGFFTLIIGRAFRVELFSPTRVCAVLARYLFDGACGSFIGVVLVARGDYNRAPASPFPSLKPPPDLTHLKRLPESHEPLLGDFLALLSAMFYALYVVLLKVRIGLEARIDMRMFFGFVGLINVCCTWIMGLLLHFTTVERLDMPSSRRQWGGVLLNMLITLSSDYIYVLAMLKTTPLVVTVGLSLTIPCALLGDAFWFDKSSPPAVLCGAALVVLAFIAVGLGDNWPGAECAEHAHIQPPTEGLQLAQD